MQSLREQMDMVVGKPLSAMSLNDLKQEAAFLRSVIQFETNKGPTIAQSLIEHGIPLPDPSSLSEDAVTEKLWEVINGLAQLGHYLSKTDHLSDLDLYQYLWSELLNEKNCVLGEEFGTIGEYHEVIDTLSIDFYRYYGDELDMLSFYDIHPDSEPPEHEELPFDRDKDLPQPSVKSNFQ